MSIEHGLLNQKEGVINLRIEGRVDSTSPKALFKAEIHSALRILLIPMVKNFDVLLVKSSGPSTRSNR